MNNYYSIDHAPNRTIVLGTGTFDFYSGTSYLGMSQDATFKRLLIEGIEQYGMTFGSSRNGNLQLAIYELAEKKLAAFAKAEAALTLSSGMMAGQVVAQYLKKEGATFFYAPHTHGANFFEMGIQVPTKTFNEWSQGIVQKVKQSQAPHSVIVCNSVDAIKLQDYNFDWLNQFPENQQITILIDDSHGLGVMGENGEGIYAKIPIKSNLQRVVISSLHKAMGIPGGVIFSDAAFLESIRLTPFFASCSPIPPAYLYAYLNAGEIYQNNLQTLRQNIEQFTTLIEPSLSNFNSLPQYPVFYTTHDSLYRYLFQKKILIYNFAYPVKTGKPNTRLVLGAWHDKNQIEYLAENINKFRFKE